MRSPVQLERVSLRTSSQRLLQRYVHSSECSKKQNAAPIWARRHTEVHRWFRQDVAAKIVAFATQSSRAVCVLSAMGSVSRAVLRHPADGSPMARVHASPQPYKNNPAIYEVRAQWQCSSN